MNNLNIIGNLTKDPELRFLGDGKPVAKFSIGVQDGYGENKHTSFFGVVVFGKQAESVNQYCFKGSKVGITGAIKQSRWESQDGSKRSNVEIIAMKVDFLTPKGFADTKPTPKGDDFGEVSEDDIPF